MPGNPHPCKPQSVFLSQSTLQTSKYFLIYPKGLGRSLSHKLQNVIFHSRVFDEPQMLCVAHLYKLLKGDSSHKVLIFLS